MQCADQGLTPRPDQKQAQEQPAQGYCPSARFGRNRDIRNDARHRFRRLTNVDRLQFFAPVATGYGGWLELFRRVSLLFRTMLLGPVPAMTIGGSAGNV